MGASGRLKSIEFSRYRAFAGLQRLELRPLTLLFGLNSAGKSAALRLLPVLASAAKHQQHGAQASVFDYNSPALRDARFQDLVNARVSSAAIPFKLSWDDFEYSIEIRSLGDAGEFLSKFTLSTDALSFDGTIIDTETKLDYDVIGQGKISKWRLLGMTPVSTQDVDDYGYVAMLSERLFDFSDSVHWLGAVRATVPRYFELRPGADGRISWDGTGVAEALRLSSEAGDGTAAAVSRWLKKTCYAELSFAKTDGAVIFKRQLYPFDLFTSDGHYVPVRDVGEGIAQALPVVTLCHQARLGHLGRNPILAFEQPELHLHPAATVHLADEIMSCVENGSPASHVIETHSESMLLSLQIAIVEKRLKPEDVIVYWVNESADGPCLRPITFDEEGFPSEGWPQGVFREALEQARHLSRLRISLD